MWVPNGLKKIPEAHFEFPFNLIGKSVITFLTGQSLYALKTCYTLVWSQNKAFGAGSKTVLTRAGFSFVFSFAGQCFMNGMFLKVPLLDYLGLPVHASSIGTLRYEDGTSYDGYQK